MSFFSFKLNLPSLSVEVVTINLDIMDTSSIPRFVFLSSTTPFIICALERKQESVKKNINFFKG